MTRFSDDGMLDKTLPGPDEFLDPDEAELVEHSDRDDSGESRERRERRDASSEHPAFARGAVIGRYMLISPVGVGAMGVVFAAYDPQLDRKIALKVLKPRGRNLQRSRERLQREAQALAKLDHPNVVSVHDVGVHEGQLFVAMEFVEGQTLDTWMESAPALSTGSLSLLSAPDDAPVRIRPWPDVLEVFMQAGRGLCAAHEAGLVHRDFKPDNVMISKDGRVRVMDFGLARIDDVETTDATDLNENVSSLTQTGAMLGTPAYMPLEQFGGGLLDARSDQFAFCVALYEALYGERPFDGETIGELVYALQKGDVRGPRRNAPVPGWIRSVVVRGLATEPEDRFESMQALLDALAADPASRRRRLAMRVGIGLALVAGSVGVLSLSGQLAQRDARIKVQETVLEDQATEIQKQADQLEIKNAELEAQLAAQARLLSVQRGLRAKTLVGTRSEAEALLLGVQAVGEHAEAWDQAPREAIEGLEQVLAHNMITIQASHSLEGHEHYVSHVVYSPDGTMLATSSYDGTAKLWDRAHARLLTTLDGHKGDIYGLAFSPDGSRLVTSGMDGKACVWDVASGERVHTLTGPKGRLFALAFSPDGTSFATGGHGRPLQVWDPDSGELHFGKDNDPEGLVSDLAYTPDGASLAVLGVDGDVRIFDAKTGRRVARLAGKEPLGTLAISPAGRHVAAGGDDERALVWSIETGEVVATLVGHKNLIKSLVYSPDGARITAASWDRASRVYDPQTGELLATLEGGHDFGVATVAYSPDGTRIATGSYGGNVALWDAETGQQLARLRGHGGDVWDLAFSSDGRQLATASADRSARLWDVGGRPVVALEGPETNARWFAYTADQSRLVTLTSDGILRVWSGESSKFLFRLDPPDRERWGPHTPLMHSPVKPELAILQQGRLYRWNTQTGVLLSNVEANNPRAHSGVFYAPGGTKIVIFDHGEVARNTSTPVKHITVFDTRDVESESRTVFAIDAEARNMRISPDDTQLAVITVDSTLQLWDLGTGTLTAEHEVPKRSARLAFSPDGSQLALFNHSAQQVEVRDAKSFALLAIVPAPDDVDVLTYAPNDNHLSAVSRSKGLWTWDPDTGQTLFRVEPDLLEQRIQGIKYSPDGRRFVLFGGGLLRTFDRQTGERLASIYTRGSFTGGIAFNRDGTQLTSMSAGILELWDTATGEPRSRERIGIRRHDGSIDWPIPPSELTRIGCERLRVYEHTYAEAQSICAPLLED